MNTIIALTGPGSSGKTTSIRILAKLLINNGYNQITIKGNPISKIGDFTALYVKDGIIIGLTSAGDDKKVGNKLKALDVLHTQICVCSCRTSGSSFNAVESFRSSLPSPNSKPILKKIPKTNWRMAGRALANSKEQEIVNNEDANKLYNEL
jgi:energy-coupling factor transporter ATP-binding protein EcfA2